MENNIQNKEAANEKVSVENNGFVLDKRDLIFAIIFTAIAICFSTFCLWSGFHAGFTFTSIITFISFTCYLYDKTKKIRVFPLVCGILSAAMSVTYSITSNPVLRFWSFVIIMGLSVIWFNSLVNEKEESGDLGIMQMIFRSLFEGCFSNLTNTVKGIFSGKDKNRKQLGSILLGLVFAVPVLLIIIPLLVSSDVAFEGFVVNFLEEALENIGKIIVGLMVAPFVISFGYALAKNRVPEKKEISFKGLEGSMIAAFLSMLSLCYLLYLFSQLAYFFSAFSGILPENYEFNLAEYARRGFFEMSIIAGINFGIIFLALLISKKKDNKIGVVSRVLCTFIGVFTLIIIATALSKMILYIKSFGMTQLRITTSAFMLFVAIVFVSLIIRLYVAKVQVIKTAFITAALILVVLGIGNVNHVVADYNYNAYISGKLEEIDVDTIYNQGAEGVPYLVLLTEVEEDNVAKQAENSLYDVLTLEQYYEVEHSEDDYDILLVGEKTEGGLEQYYAAKGKAYEALDDLIEKGFEHYSKKFVKVSR